VAVLQSSIIGSIELTKERLSHTYDAHPELKPHSRKLAQVIQNPDEIRRSRFDQNVLLFYKYFASIKGGKYINITVKTNNRNFVFTAYITDKIKAGEPYETK